MDHSKNSLRKNYLSKRKKIRKDQINQLSEQICNQFLKFFPLDKNLNIHVFLPIFKTNEVNTWLLISELQKMPNVSLFTPKVIEHEMIQTQLKPDSKLIQNKFGADEVESHIPNFETMDYILFPLVYADKNGQRIGYGKGYYDRFFANSPPESLKIGVGFFSPKEEIANSETHDLKLDYLVLPTEVLSFCKKSLK